MIYSEYIPEIADDSDLLKAYGKGSQKCFAPKCCVFLDCAGCNCASPFLPSYVRMSIVCKGVGDFIPYLKPNRSSMHLQCLCSWMEQIVEDVGQYAIHGVRVFFKIKILLL